VEILQSGIYDLITYEKLAIVCVQSNPVKWIEQRERRVMHCEDGPAIEWEDGFKVYSLWGITLREELYKNIVEKQLSFKEIMGIENIEQRMVALKMMEPDELLKGSKAELLDKSAKGNELYLIKEIFSQPAYYLKYTCPSTGRVYISGIDPEIGKKKKADEAMVWKFPTMRLEDYTELIEA
jgi:hypothetical protein